MKVSYQMKGMTCGHCLVTVEKEFSKQGIDAKADLKTNSVSIYSEIDDVMVSIIKKTLEKEGYELGSKI
jgi:copper chaperone CopZ